MNIVLIIKSAKEVAGFISCLYHFINAYICGNCWWLVLSVGEMLCQQPSAAVVFPVLGEFWELTAVWLRDRRGAHEPKVNQGTDSSWQLGNPNLKLFHTNLMPSGGMWEVCTTSSVRIPCQFPQCPWVSLWTGNFCFWQPWVGVVLLEMAQT